MNFFDESLSLPRLRSALIRMEDTIIFGLIERAQFHANVAIYEPGRFRFQDGFPGSFMDFFLLETEKLHAKVRRYTSPDEHPFFDDLPAPILPLLDYPRILKDNGHINVNAKIKEVYLKELIPAICAPGDDANYGSSATRDVECLQALSKRIHYGKFIAEAKFIDPVHHDEYVRLIRERNAEGLDALLTNKEVETRLLQRIRLKAAMYGQDITEKGPAESKDRKIDPQAVADLYEKWVIPLTKEVEVLYLLARLDGEDGAGGTQEGGAFGLKRSDSLTL